MDKEGEKDELKIEHKVFCEEYVIDWNQTRAYMVAYPNSKESSARANASRLIANDNIQSYIKEVQKDLSKLTGVTAARNIKELAKIAYSNISDFKKDWFEFKDWEDLTENQKAAIAELTHSEINIGEDMVKVVEKLKTHDKLKAIAMLNKMLGFDEPEPREEKTQNNNLVIVVGKDGVEQLPATEQDIEDFTENE